MKVFAFVKARNEVLKEGNLYSMLECLRATCDGGVLCDDASTDGTAEILEEFVRSQTTGSWALLKIEASEQDFSREMFVKQQMMDVLHGLEEKPDWVFWLDGDEVLDAKGVAHLRTWLSSLSDPKPAYRCHYTQAWQNTSWARTDSGFDEGAYFKLWRYAPDLRFDVREGTHRAQFPTSVDPAAQDFAPFEIVHLGNVGANLKWKAIQYSRGRGGIDRHVAFGHSPEESLATGEGWDQAKYSEPKPTYREVDPKIYPSFVERRPGPRPAPFPLDFVRRLRGLGDLKLLPETFAVVVPAFNRARFLPKALDSLLYQTHEKWVAFVLDDGSTDDTAAVMRRYQAEDARIFYARFATNRGGVAMNEIGMSIACEAAEWWTRLGSDDWFGPDKLALDAQALRKHGACWGCYTVQRTDAQGTRLEEVCGASVPSAKVRSLLMSGGFVASWANAAVRTEVLREVRRRFGHFVDPRLRNMEDFLANAYVATVADWRWRGVVDGKYCDDEAYGLKSEVLEGIWNDAPQHGASGNQSQSGKDDVLTRQIIAGLGLKLAELGVSMPGAAP